MELLSRLAELQQSEEEDSTEIESILRRLKEIGEGGEARPDDIDEDAESIEDELDLAERVSGLDIDKLSEEELWELLSSKEKARFMSLVKDGGVARLVPPWKPCHTWPYGLGCVRNYAVATVKKNETSAAIQSKQALEFDWALNKLDSSVRRTGRITKTLLLRIFHDICRAGMEA
ncbi:unnamed protein product [Tetraodon nigroviridis]|uniref:(spotted green pufferfish) hypothetical protein n=1 Tax=Tetraodon nigroviridis TaxID=99883 RepID=Q4SQJ9_TETNG|nr:unnamed protein product [Tetraodon nigroviridis]